MAKALLPAASAFCSGVGVVDVCANPEASCKNKSGTSMRSSGFMETSRSYLRTNSPNPVDEGVFQVLFAKRLSSQTHSVGVSSLGKDVPELLYKWLVHWAQKYLGAL